MNGTSETIQLKRKDQKKLERLKLIALLIFTNTLTFIMSSSTQDDEISVIPKKYIRAGYVEVIAPLKLFIPSKISGESQVSLLYENEIIIPKAFIQWSPISQKEDQGLFSEDESTTLYTIHVLRNELPSLLRISSKNKSLHASPFFPNLKKRKNQPKGASYVISI